jgi:hypothetical protein
MVDNRLNPPKLNTPREAATATVGQGVSSLRAGAPAQRPAPGDLLLPTWHTLGRSRDDFVSITPQPRAPLQFTQRVRRLGCDPESSSGPPARRSRKSRPTSVNGPGATPARCQLERAGHGHSTSYTIGPTMPTSA